MPSPGFALSHKVNAGLILQSYISAETRAPCGEAVYKCNGFILAGQN